ncbi:hypothetical protein [Pelotomaculum sp. FP]|nr:hypothetical protein [Pelotomaculum sp. FP]
MPPSPFWYPSCPEGGVTHRLVVLTSAPDFHSVSLRRVIGSDC